MEMILDTLYFNRRAKTKETPACKNATFYWRGEFALNMTLDLKLNTDIHELLNFCHVISVNKTNLHQN